MVNRLRPPRQPLLFILLSGHVLVLLILVGHSHDEGASALDLVARCGQRQSRPHVAAAEFDRTGLTELHRILDEPQHLLLIGLRKEPQRRRKRRLIEPGTLREVEGLGLEPDDALGLDAKLLEVGPVRNEVLTLPSSSWMDVPPEEDSWNSVGAKLWQTFVSRALTHSEELIFYLLLRSEPHFQAHDYSDLNQLRPDTKG